MIHSIPANNGFAKSSSGLSRGDGGDDQLDLLSSFISSDYLLDDLMFPLSHNKPPTSFEVPFDDPTMEPRPLEAIIASKDHLPSLHTNTLTIALSIINPNKHDGTPDAGRNQLHEPTITDNGEPSSSGRFRPSQKNVWTTNYKRLLRFRNKHGHSCVPNLYSEDPVLARWTKRQRNQYKKLKEGDPKSTLTPHRLEKLESVGFVWCVHAEAWMEKLNELKEFKQIKGHCNVPSIYNENQPLSTWVKSQRRQYKHLISGERSPMTMDRFRKLQSLGFVFEPRKPIWENSEESGFLQETNDYYESLWE